MGIAFLGRTGVPHAHAPGRPVAGQGILLIGRNRVVAQAGEIIVGVVVFANVRETVVPVLAFVPAAFGRAMRAQLFAAGPFATRTIGLRALRPAGLRAQTVEKG